MFAFFISKLNDLFQFQFYLQFFFKDEMMIEMIYRLKDIGGLGVPVVKRWSVSLEAISLLPYQV